MNAVISAEQAKQITGGRTPLVPVEYEAAVKALQSCVTLDEAKYWGDKSDALAAWAKIYRSDEAGIEARRLKLHAYRRMGELAEEIQPRGYGKPRGGTGRGRSLRSALPGPRALLLENGLSKEQARSALSLASVDKEQFDSLVNLPRPPGLSGVRMIAGVGGTTEAWKKFAMETGNAVAFRSWARRNDPAELARGMSVDEAARARTCVNELNDWLDEFEQHLPRERK